MGSRLSMGVAGVMALGIGGCGSEKPLASIGAAPGVGVSGHEGIAGANQGAGGTSHSGLPKLGFAGTGTGRNAMGLCPKPPGAVCTGSLMDYHACLNTHCTAMYTECYGTDGYCLAVMGCTAGCHCGDTICEQDCYPKDCTECLQRLDECANASSC
ncbi:hypothetical protein ACFL5O_08785, partial [Myxococcota bacterium]